MKALVADAEWSPRAGYRPAEEEIKRNRAFRGSRVWKNPRFEIREVPEPVVHDDEVLIKVKSCGICGSDTHVYKTDEEGYIIFSGLTKFPCIPGHEFSGVVEKTGKNVRELKAGDIVAVESIMWCGICQPCRSGAPNQCRNVELMGLSSDGAFAEFASVKEQYCWKINEISNAYKKEDVFDVGALIEPAGCAYNGLFIAGGGFNPGAVVAVYGAGPIGLGAIALSRVAGAGRIIAFDSIPERLNLASSMGADHVYNIGELGKYEASGKVLELTGGRGADVQVEAAGSAPYTLPEMERGMAVNGRIIYLGRAASEASLSLDIFVSGAGQLVGSRGHSGYGIYPSLIRLIASGRLRLEKMITSRFPFSSIMDALELSSRYTDGKIVIKF